MTFKVMETNKFLADLEEALYWLYSNNLEQSQDFADRKFHELEQEINTLKVHLKETPRMGQIDEVSGLRRFPVYGGRYIASWIIDETANTVTLLEFRDAKYPQRLREFQFDED